MTTEYLIKYPVGSFVYSIPKSKKGVLLYMVIKKYEIKITERTSSQPIILYTDTLNGLWNEDELCSKVEAVQNAIDYYQRLLAEIEAQEG